MARNKFDVDENLESPFSFAHLKRAMKYVKKHAFKMVLALVLSCIASVVALFGPKIMQWAWTMPCRITISACWAAWPCSTPSS